MIKDLDKLIGLALENKKKAYAPYSGFRVSAVVRTGDGEVFSGVNIENSSYPVTLCAERAALGAAISQGYRDFEVLVIAGDSDYTYPCGMCRQFLAEFLGEDSKIVIARDEEDYKIYSMEDLLPHSFSKEDLER